METILIDYDKWRQCLANVKDMLEWAVRQRNRKIISQIETFNRDICLVAANFQCQNPKCKHSHNLQMHHLIMREAKLFMDYWRYVHQRYYWGNQVILCRDCHKLYHKLLGSDINEETDCISEEKIMEIKLKFKKVDDGTGTGIQTF